MNMWLSIQPSGLGTHLHTLYSGIVLLART